MRTMCIFDKWKLVTLHRGYTVASTIHTILFTVLHTQPPSHVAQPTPHKGPLDHWAKFHPDRPMCAAVNRGQQTLHHTDVHYTVFSGTVILIKNKDSLDGSTDTIVSLSCDILTIIITV